jgi:hypothetical protein
MPGTIDNFIVEKNLAHATWTPGLTTQALVSGTATLTVDSTTSQIFTGATAGQILKLPDAQTLAVGWKFTISDDGTASMAVQDNAGVALVTLLPKQRLIAVCTSIGTAAGTWSLTIEEQSSFKMKSGTVINTSFTGTPRKATVTFSTAFANASYTVNVTGSDGRIWVVESLVAGSFVISSQANAALTGSVYWQAIAVGEL